MTNIFGGENKLARKGQLFEIAIAALGANGWEVSRVPGSGKSSVRRISKGTIQKIVSVKTTQDTWIAFPRTAADDAWSTLADVDLVVVSSVDDEAAPKVAQVHLIEASEMRSRFDRAYVARRAAGRSQPVGRGVWLSLYDRETDDPVTLVGAGAGLINPPVARVPLVDAKSDSVDLHVDHSPQNRIDELPLSIAEAKRRLALTLGVDQADIHITITA